MCCYFLGCKCKQWWKSCLQFSIPTGSGAGGDRGVSHRLKSMWNTFSVCLSRSTESATEAISLALHSVPHALKGRNSHTSFMNVDWKGEHYNIHFDTMAVISDQSFEMSKTRNHKRIWVIRFQIFIKARLIIDGVTPGESQVRER